MQCHPWIVSAYQVASSGADAQAAVSRASQRLLDPRYDRGRVVRPRQQVWLQRVVGWGTACCRYTVAAVTAFRPLLPLLLEQLPANLTHLLAAHDGGHAVRRACVAMALLLRLGAGTAADAIARALGLAHIPSPLEAISEASDAALLAHWQSTALGVQGEGVECGRQTQITGEVTAVAASVQACASCLAASGTPACCILFCATLTLSCDGTASLRCVPACVLPTCSDGCWNSLPSRQRVDRELVPTQLQRRHRWSTAFRLGRPSAVLWQPAATT
jgi:hypothetical protein